MTWRRGFETRGWTAFPYEATIEAWARHAAAAAFAAEAAGQGGPMVRCGGTWFVGVDALPNDAAGRLPGGPPLAGAAIDAAKGLVGAPFSFDAGQASICQEGYPLRDAGDGEDDAAFRYRVKRDAAHIDGFHRIMPGRRRLLKEAHAFILGLPLNDTHAGAAPFVLWEGSHLIMGAAFRDIYCGVPERDWPDLDVTEAYQAARRHCFESCERIEITGQPGEAYLVHRHALHGVAPWRGGPGARAIAYFRPDPFPGEPFGWWLGDVDDGGSTLS